ncbi:MAG: prephenate dehydratase domain-containing protein [Candidatus Margulisiibacteriota bacterium]
MKIGYLGPKGTFTHYACEQVVNIKQNESDPVLLDEYLSLDALFDALDLNLIDAILSPFENSIEGPVNRVLDSFLTHRNFYVSQLYEMPIQQSLVSFNPELNINDIQHVVSMPHAIAQCYQFIKTYCPSATIHHAPSTAGSVSLIDALKLPHNSTAIIGHKNIANYFNIYVLKQNINDQKHNTTQFSLIEKSDNSPVLNAHHNRCLIAFSTSKDTPGSLLNVLEIFKSYDVNLTKILSRPEKKETGSYIFYIEFSIESAKLSNIEILLSKVRSNSVYFRNLGFYWSSELND